VHTRDSRGVGGSVEGQIGFQPQLCSPRL